MSSTIIIRRAFFAALFTLVCALPRAGADPVVYYNSSHIFGYVTILVGGLPVTFGNYFDTAETGPSPGTSGPWEVADMRAVSEQGAGATIESSVAGTLTPDLFTGTGRVFHTASAPASGEIGAQSWGRSVFNISFELDQPYYFAYAGHYFAEGDGVFGIMAASLSPLQGQFGQYLPPIFSDDFRFFRGTLAESTRYADALAPGFYNLTVVTDPLYIVAPGEAFRNSGFDFSFGLTPVPEPTSLVLLGAGGLAAAAGRKWRQRRSRSASTTTSVR